MRRRPASQANVVVGWVEVWTISADELVREEVQLELPRMTPRFEEGRYRLRERKSLPRMEAES